MACGKYYHRGFIESVLIDEQNSKALLPEIMNLLPQESEVDQFNQPYSLAWAFAVIDEPVARDIIQQALVIMDKLNQIEI